jgi:methenyltetrahydrofolate cyclohydrolase
MRRVRSSDSSNPLAARSVREFLDSVASSDEAVPAGGSVAALTGAASAALLALVCGVLQHKGIDGLSEMLARAQDLQHRLLALVDEDAEAFRAFLHARQHVDEVVGRVTQVPLEVASRCVEVVALCQDVEDRTQGPMLGDVRSARHLASAALSAALDLADQNVSLHSDPAAQARLREEIFRLRSAHAGRKR